MAPLPARRQGRTAAGELGIQAVARQQLGMGADVDDAAGLHHHDAVGAQHGGQAVGDHQRGAPGHQPFQRLLHHVLALGVEGRGGLVEQQHRGVLQQGAGDGDALLLAAGEPRATLAELALVALRQGADELVGLGQPRRAQDVLAARLQPAVADVLGRRGGEDHRVLRHQGDLAAQGQRVELAQVDAVEGDTALLRVVEAQQQLQHAALAGARGADQGHRLARAQLEGDAVERRLPGARGIVEAHALQRHGAAHRRR
jgi:hypothetical protein